MSRRRRGRKKLEGVYEPFDEIMKGDVILWNGVRRKVRDVTRYTDDAIDTITFAILHRSWTDRPYTVYGRADLRNAFGGIVAKGASLCTTRNECLTQKEIEAESNVRIIRASEMVGTVW